MEKISNTIGNMMLTLMTTHITKLEEIVEEGSTKFWIKVYNVNSSAKYAWPSIRIDIQNLQPRDYS